MKKNGDNMQKRTIAFLTIWSVSLVYTRSDMLEFKRDWQRIVLKKRKPSNMTAGFKV